MGDRDYPLNALRAFEAAARHLSFVRAADELHVTPAAISHLVKKLEQYLQVSLFKRQARGLLLTDAGQSLWSETRDAFERLDKAVGRVRNLRPRETVTLSVAPIFAAKWLLPRLARFGAAHPGIDLRLSSTLNLVDLARDGFDAAVRLGDGQYKGLAADFLFNEGVTPMVSPHLLAARPPIKTADDLDGMVLLHDDSMTADPEAPNWATWLADAGASHLDPARGPRFGQPDYALQAAIDGAGVVLGWRHMAADDLAAGRLVAPFSLELSLGRAFYLVYPKAAANRRSLQAFRVWLLDAAAKMAEARAPSVAG